MSDPRKYGKDCKCCLQNYILLLYDVTYFNEYIFCHMYQIFLRNYVRVLHDDTI
jgi:hypothetical protein